MYQNNQVFPLLKNDLILKHKKVQDEDPTIIKQNRRVSIRILRTMYNAAMTTTQSIAAQITVRGKNTSPIDIELELRSMTNSERLSLAFKYFIVSLMVTIITVAVPILHFVLVPLGLIVSVYLFFSKFQTKHFKEKTNVKCPECESNIEIKKGPFNWPIKQECPSCRQALLINPK